MTIETEERWSTPVASEITGASDRQLQHWAVRGFVWPERSCRLGNLRWSLDDLLRVAVLLHLIDQHRPGEERARAISRASLDADLLLIRPRVKAVTPEEVANLSHHHSVVTVLPLASMRAQLTRKLAATA